MAQIICMGASTVYGVGGPNGGWADMLKLALHKQMYGGTDIKEAYEVFIFAKSGITVDFIARGYKQRVKDYARDGCKTVVVLSVGLNNARAVETPDGYVSSPKEYAAQMKHLLEQMTGQVDAIVCVGFTPVDESKTTKKINPFTQQRSYFMNQRIKVFNDAFRQAAEEAGGTVQFLDLFDRTVKLDWIGTYLSPDGLHPNGMGHRWIYEQVMSVVLDMSE